MASPTPNFQQLADEFENTGDVNVLVQIGEALMCYSDVKEGKLLFMMKVSEDQFNTGLSSPNPSATYIGVFSSTCTIIY